MEEVSRESRAARIAGPAALVVLFAALLVWSWRKWMDVHVDFGNELYVAWQLSEGKALYRDIAQRNGPLSHTWNALLFAVFGASIRTLALANLAVLAAIACMVWRMFARACDRTTATLSVAVLLCVFAFGQATGIANFNYVTPYHHFQTHGLALSLAMLLCFDAATRGPTRPWLLTGGVCLGAVFLTKAELFAPALAVACAAFAARGAGVWGERGRASGDLLCCGLGALLPVAGFALWLGSQMPAAVALHGLLGNWAHLSGLLSDPFYRAGAGLDDVAGNLRRDALAVHAIAAFVALASALDRIGRGRAGGTGVASALLAGLGFAALWVGSARLPWPELARALPFTSLLAALWLAVRLRRQASPDARTYGLFLWAVYSTVLLAKLGLAARFFHYGFVLAMPATLLLVAGGVYALPAALRARGGGGGLARALAVGVIAAYCALFLSVSQRHYREKRFEIGEGGDAILAEVPAASIRPQVIAQTLAKLRALARPTDTLLVLPEGLSLNYWLRMENPIPYGLFLPTEVEAFGEARMLAALEAHPPDFVVLAHRLSDEFGVGPFGRDPRNGRALLAWVEAHYHRVARFGAEPFRGQGFGTVVLERSLR